jgi:hypothetical protein
MGIEEEEQTKGINNIFNKIRAENASCLEKERVIQLQEAFRTSNRQVQRREPPSHIIVRTLNTQNKE